MDWGPTGLLLGVDRLPAGQQGWACGGAEIGSLPANEDEGADRVASRGRSAPRRPVGRAGGGAVVSTEAAELRPAAEPIPVAGLKMLGWKIGALLDGCLDGRVSDGRMLGCSDGRMKAQMDGLTL